MSRSELRQQLIDRLLQEELDLTLEGLAEQVGLDTELVQRIWRTLGFPDPRDAQAFGEADANALALMKAATDQEILDPDTVMRLTRGLGQTMSKLADWEVATLIDQLERDIVSGKSSSRLEGAVWLAENVAPHFETLIVHVWRRHLVAAAARMEALGAADKELQTSNLSVGFADLSRFTSLSNTLEDTALAALVERFEERCGDVIALGGGRVIKTMGDAILYTAQKPTHATNIALNLVSQVGSRDSLPAIRVGLATGQVIGRLGDVFGPPVNLAARLSNVARSNRVLVDETTADALGPEFEKRALPPRPLRGFGHISPITVSHRRTFRAR